MWQAVARLLNEHLGSAEIRKRVELPGGTVNSAWYIEYGDYPIFVKYNTKEMLATFSTEAEQLRLLTRTKTVQIPQVYGVGYDRDHSFLLMEYKTLKPLDAHSAYCLGQQLAHLHRWGEQPQYGFDFDNDLATAPQPNVWQRRWGQFFAEQRIGWQLQLAAEKGLIFGDIDNIITMVNTRLQGYQPKSSLLHGDLWPKNCAMSETGPIIFNPACYWGDRECDLAMLPYYLSQPSQILPSQIYDGYQSIWPLDSGFLERQPLYQLYHLINRGSLLGGRHIAIAQQSIEKLLHDEQP